MFEIGKILMHDIMYVATYVKVKCIGEVIWKLMAERGEGGLWAKPPENVFAYHALQTVGKRRKHLLTIYIVLILAGEGCRCATSLFSGDFFPMPMHFASSRWTYLGLPTWNAAWQVTGGSRLQV